MASLTDVDWSEQAVITAQGYLEVLPFSRADLHGQLIFHGFSQEEADYGVSSCGADWKEQALRAAREIDDPTTSREAIRAYLEFCSFSESEIEYALDNM